MSDIDDLQQMALELKEKGLNEKDIATELHVSINTVTWLLTRNVGKDDAIPDADVKIGWRSIGVMGHRIRLTAEILADIIIEEVENRQLDPSVIVGVAHNGISLATHLSDVLDTEFTLYRPSPDRKEPGTISSNFAGIRGKEAIIVDDVLGSGDTIRAAVRDIRAAGGKPVLITVLVNKTRWDDIQNVPVRALIRAVTLQ